MKDILIDEKLPPKAKTPTHSTENSTNAARDRNFRAEADKKTRDSK
jgi:hypothetical protein